MAPARRGSLVTFGVSRIVRTPATATSRRGERGKANPALAVKRFVEKPSREVAQTYLDSGRFYWNAGIFLFKASTMLEQFQTHAPEILALSPGAK